MTYQHEGMSLIQYLQRRAEWLRTALRTADEYAKELEHIENILVLTNEKK